MVAGISAGINSYTYLFSDYQSNTFGVQNDFSNNSFEKSLNDIQNSPDLISADDIQNVDGESNSSKSSSDMDLNRDGIISVDEIMKYMELQMQENLESADLQGENNGQNSRQNGSFSQCFQMPFSKVVAAYSIFK